MIASEPQLKSAIPAVAQTGLVLVVDDYDDARFLVMCALHRNKLKCIEAASGEQALEQVMADPDAIDAIALDVMMPGIDGFEVARRLREVPETSGIPIIMVTASATEDRDVVRGVEHGVVDYITKPCSPTVLVAKVRSACERTRETRRLKRELASAEGRATIDPLTGLFNRRHFEDRLEEAGAYAKRYREEFSLILLSIDESEVLGEAEERDRAAAHLAEAIRATVRSEDLAFRFDVEKLALLLRKCDAARGIAIAERLRNDLKPFELADGRYRSLTFSGGAAAVHGDEDFSRADLVSRAEIALAQAKAAGGARVI
jgi:diguanylate cyclase (GGDEF)-like protein